MYHYFSILNFFAEFLKHTFLKTSRTIQIHMFSILYMYCILLTMVEVLLQVLSAMWKKLGVSSNQDPRCIIILNK